MKQTLLTNSFADETIIKNRSAKYFFRGIADIGDPLNPFADKEFIIDKKYLYKIEQSLKQKNFSETTDLVSSLIETIKLYESTNEDYIRNIFYRIVFILGKAAEIHNISISNRSDSLICLIAHATTIDEIKHEFLNAISLLSDFVLFNIKAPLEPIDKLNNYINEHYLESDISISSIAKSLNFTDTYLCLLYKKKTNKTIHQKIIEMRVDKAKYLIKNTKNRLYVIAKNVGYANCRYFSKVFLKNVGLSPKKYRESYALK